MRATIGIVYIGVGDASHKVWAQYGGRASVDEGGT